MVKANELRHCNYYYFSGNSEGLFDYENKLGQVFINDKFKYYVEFKDISNEMLEKFSHSQIQPIPLTPEILINWCGFDKKRLSNNWITLSNYIDGSFSINVDGFTDTGIGTSVSYLHELQNAYFVLQKEELPIKLPEFAD